MEMMCFDETEEVCIVADEEITKEFLYNAINSDYEIGSIEINSYEYDGPYLTSIDWNDDNYAITVERARADNGRYLVSGAATYIQDDLDEKCEYINDVTRNKYIDADLAIFTVGEDADDCDETEDEDDKPSVYTYANEYDGDGVYGQIFVSSNLKDFVEDIKMTFEDIFLD